LLALKKSIRGRWKSGRGSGGGTSSSLSQETYSFRDDFSYSYQYESSRVVYVSAAYPFGRASAGSTDTDSDRGIYIVCNPEELLLASGKGRTLTVRLERKNDVLMLNRAAYWRAD